jgi:hypothetical protein
LIHKLVLGDKNDEQLVEFMTGRYNDFPPGWKEISQEEFVKKKYSEIVPTFVEGRYMLPAGNDRLKKEGTHATLFHLPNGVGYAFVCERKGYDKNQTNTMKFYEFDIFEKLKKWFNVLIANDSGWKGSGGIPHRGINDFARVISFNRTLSERDMHLVKMYLARDNCPGWTGIFSRQNADTTYTFTTTWDSSG